MKVKLGVIAFEGCHFWLTTTSSPFSCTQLYVYKHALQRYSLNIQTYVCLYYIWTTYKIHLSDSYSKVNV